MSYKELIESKGFLPRAVVRHYHDAGVLSETAAVALHIAAGVVEFARSNRKYTESEATIAAKLGLDYGRVRSIVCRLVEAGVVAREGQNGQRVKERPWKVPAFDTVADCSELQIEARRNSQPSQDATVPVANCSPQPLQKLGATVAKCDGHLSDSLQEFREREEGSQAASPLPAPDSPSRTDEPEAGGATRRGPVPGKQPAREEEGGHAAPATHPPDPAPPPSQELPSQEQIASAIWGVKFARNHHGRYFLMQLVGVVGLVEMEPMECTSDGWPMEHEEEWIQCRRYDFGNNDNAVLKLMRKFAYCANIRAVELLKASTAESQKVFGVSWDTFHRFARAEAKKFKATLAAAAAAKVVVTT